MSLCPPDPDEVMQCSGCTSEVAVLGYPGAVKEGVTGGSCSRLSNMVTPGTE